MLTGPASAFRAVDIVDEVALLAEVEAIASSST